MSIGYCGKLHGAAMKTAMLFDDTSTVDAHDLTLRKSLTDETKRFCVEIRLGVGGTEHGTVDAQEVGISGRQTIVLIIDRTRRGECGQRRLQPFQFGVVFIRRVVATHM